MKNRQQQLSEKAHEERRRCRDWVSKLSFDMGWIMAIEDTGRHDWYEPLRRRSRTRN
jgi:hypothetical protein